MSPKNKKRLIIDDYYKHLTETDWLNKHMNLYMYTKPCTKPRKISKWLYRYIHVCIYIYMWYLIGITTGESPGNRKIKERWGSNGACFPISYKFLRLRIAKTSPFLISENRPISSISVESIDFDNQLNPLNWAKSCWDGSWE